MYLVRRFTFFYGLLLLSVFSHADPVALLNEQMQGIDTISARFKQQIVDEKKQLMQEGSGYLLVKQPRKLYWLTEDPYQHLVVTNGIDLWIYDMDLEQVNKEAFSEDLDRAPALLLSGNVQKIAENYHVKQLPSKVGQQIFQLLPKDQRSVFSDLTVVFSDHHIVSMTLIDSFAQRTQIDFFDVVNNAPLDESLFNFVVPEGVDVITNEH